MKYSPENTAALCADLLRQGQQDKAAYIALMECQIQKTLPARAERGHLSEELISHLFQLITMRERLINFVNDDASAITYQTLGQYRETLTRMLTMQQPEMERT